MLPRDVDERISIENVFCGDRGESTVTKGGECGCGVLNMIEEGRGGGGPGFNFRAVGAIGVVGTTGAPAVLDPVPTALLSPPAVFGLAPVFCALSHAGFCPTGDGGAASSFPRLSNCDRSAESGLKDVVSGPSRFCAILMLLLYCSIGGVYW